MGRPGKYSKPRPASATAHPSPSTAPATVVFSAFGAVGLQRLLQVLPLIGGKNLPFGGDHVHLSFEERVANLAHASGGRGDVLARRMIAVERLAEIAHRRRAVAFEPLNLVAIVCRDAVERRELIVGEIQASGDRRLVPPIIKRKKVQA